MSKLRGKKPEEKNPRLKALMFGPAGVGKTTAAIQMPKPYVIDCEGGTSHYGEIIEKKGGAVFETTSMTDVIEEVRALASEKHDYLTLVVDPFTAIYDTELERAEKVVGSDFGRHYGQANKTAKRLYHLLSQLDMNVVVTCHSKNVYGDGMKLAGTTFDGWKRLDYLFDTVFSLDRDPKNKKLRIAKVAKTRLVEFPDQDVFPWSYDELARRYGDDKLTRHAETIDLPNDEQLAQFRGLYEKLSDAELKRLKISTVIKSIDEVDDLPASRLQKGIDLMSKHLKGV